ncbi:MAG: ABC transporter ATP-binding protein [Polyangia bacterium]
MTVQGLDVEVQGNIGELTVALALHAAPGPTVIVGPNGAGKTSLLMFILGAMSPAQGQITLDGRALFDHARGIDVPVENRQIGFLPQRYALFPHLDVLGNISYGLSGRPPPERARLARAALRELGVEDLAARRSDQLSGGEAQRVALARALAHGPRALLLDEPLAALDASLRRDVRRFLAAQLRTLAIPTLIVTHDHADAEAFGGEVVVIEHGTVTQRGRLAVIATNPATDFVRQFVHEEPAPRTP